MSKMASRAGETPLQPSMTESGPVRHHNFGVRRLPSTCRLYARTFAAMLQAVFVENLTRGDGIGCTHEGGYPFDFRV